MKKVLCLVASILLLAGCSDSTSYTTVVTDGDTNVATVGNAAITRQDIYECLMDASGVDYVLNDVLTHIASSYEVNEEELNKMVAETETTWKAILGDQIDSYTKNNFGYETFEDYKEAILIPSTRQIMMINQYSVDNFDSLANQYLFVKCRQIIVDDQATAMTAISEISSEEISFEDAVEKYSTDATNKSNKGEIGLVSDLSTCTADSSIIAILPQLTIKAVYSSPIELSTGKYAVLEIVETDKEVLKDEILTELQGAEEVVTAAEAYYLEQNGFTIVDEFLKEQMQALYPDYVK